MIIITHHKKLNSLKLWHNVLNVSSLARSLKLNLNLKLREIDFYFVQDETKFLKDCFFLKASDGFIEVTDRARKESKQKVKAEKIKLPGGI